VQQTNAWFLGETLVAFGVVGVLALVLRWAFSRGSSVVRRPASPGRVDEYGLLVPVAAPRTYDAADLERRALEAAGIRVTLAQTLAGPRLMVFAEDVSRARAVLDAR
jgi:hypothetical protein